MENLDLLRHLCQAQAPSGFEESLISMVAARMRRWTDEVEIDRLGNVTGWLRCQLSEAQTVMIIAHMDEVGFVVRKVEDSGLLRLWRIGGIPEKAMAGQAVLVCPDGHDTVPGVIGGRSHHVLTDDEKYVVDPIIDVFVDVGLRNRQEADAAGISIGTPVTWFPFFHLTEAHVMSKALDNRLGLYVVLELMRRLSELSSSVNVVLAATVHEEWSAWGAMPSARTVRPDMAVVVDVAIASDTPGMEPLTDTRLGSGPVINTYLFHPRGPHMGTIPNHKLRKRLVETAENDQIPYQLGTFYGGVTDGSTIQYLGRGVPVLDVGIPTRYTHYPVEVASLGDADATIRLLERFLTQLPPRLDLSRG